MTIQGKNDIKAFRKRRKMRLDAKYSEKSAISLTKDGNYATIVMRENPLKSPVEAYRERRAQRLDEKARYDYGVLGMKWGHHKEKDPTDAKGKSGRKIVSGTEAAKDCKLPSTRSKEAQAAYDKARSAEPKITEMMCEIADIVGSKMHGLKYSVKTASSLEDKIQRQMKAAREAGEEISDVDVVSNMNDIVRYTQMTDHDNIGDAALKTIDELKARGCEIVEVDNKYLYEKPGYRGVHINAKSPNGQPFEMQIHSDVSMEAKEKGHPLYEEYRNVNTSPERKLELDRQMNEIYSAVPMPKNIDKVKNYKKGE